MFQFGKSEEQKKIEQTELTITSYVRGVVSRSSRELSFTVGGWASLAAIAAKNDPHDKKFTEQKYLADNEAYFKAKIATVNIEILNAVIVASKMIGELPESRRTKMKVMVVSELTGMLEAECNETKNPAQVVWIRNIPVSGMDIVTFLSVQRDALEDRLSRTEPLLRKITAINEQFTGLAKRLEEDRDFADVKGYPEMLRKEAEKSYKEHHLLQAHEECTAYLAATDRLLASAMGLELKGISISAPLLLTDLDYIHKHGSEVHYLQK